MTFSGWMAVAGGLLLFMALSAPWVRRFPVSTSIIYLGFGLAIGPFGLQLIRIDVRESFGWLEPITEVAVIISLFVGGLKLRLPIRSDPWRAAYRLAGPVMVLSIVGVTLFAHLASGLDFALALLIAAILAPTDPVLAGAVTVNNAADHDGLRYGLSGEAGLNDGAAFPFVVLALLFFELGAPGTWTLVWVVQHVLWAIPVGLALGYYVGKGVGRLAIWLRARHADDSAPSDFLALALIAVVYVGADAIGAWGFLAVFAAGVGLRRAEMAAVGPHEHTPAEHLVVPGIEAGTRPEPAVAAGLVVAETLSFGATAERLLEVLLVVGIGASLPVHWDVRAVPLALALLCVIRPLATHASLIGTPTTPTQRWLMGWFGIRGIGSLYYLSYALDHGVVAADATDAAAYTISVLTVSVVLHGITVTPLLQRYERSLSR